MEKSSPPRDPRVVLAVGEGASDDEIRAAYLRKLKEFPPDRCPTEFEQVRDAYELLRDRRQRFRHLLFSVDPAAPLETLLDKEAEERHYTGPEPWLAVLREK
jgi:curved DNA-binding protein CbpA